MNLFFTEPPGLAGKRVPLRDLLRSSKFRLIMRISFVNMVLLVGSIQLLVASPALGQDLQQIEVKLELSQAPLKDVFAQIESQTDLLFVYPREVNAFSEVTLEKGTYTVKEVLDKVLAGTSLGYRKTKNNVVIFVEGESEEEEVPVNAGAVMETVTGRIVDAAAQPIPGVNVLVKGTTRGTTSDADGQYAIEVERDEILVFSFIGFKAASIAVDARTTIDVRLEQDVAMLKEVTVSTDYYETTDKLKTGSIVKITSKEIENQPVTSPLMALQGRVPGLEITPPNGMPGVAPTIRIRGTNSLRNYPGEGNGNYPLYVIDGVPFNSMPIGTFSNSYTSAGYDPLSTINPSDIETIQILKDGDATAIYGSRGANGVILITTKRSNKALERTNVDLSSYVGIGHVSKRLELLNRQQYIAMRREAFANDGLIPSQFDVDLTEWDTTRNTDWQKLLIGESARITDIQGSITSGNKNTSFRVGGGYHKETMVFPGDFGYKRATTQLSVNHTSENNKFRMTASASLGLDNTHIFTDAGGLLNSALTLPPHAPRLYNDDGTLNWEIHNLAGFTTATWVNPISYLRNTQKTSTQNLITNATFSYDFLRSLSFTTNIGYTNLLSYENTQSPRGALDPTITQDAAVGTSNFLDNKRTSWIVEPRLSYSRKIADHKIDIVAGTTWQTSNTLARLVIGEKYASDALLGSLDGAGQITSVRDDVMEYKYTSVYARIGYNWQEKYLLNLTGRRDGSSRFGPGNRFGNFGAIGAAWIFSNSKFVQRMMPFIFFGKVRTSYGITGSDQVGDYKYYNLYDILPMKYQNQSGFVPFALYNPDFAWEATKKIEAAIELGLFDNQIGLEFGWYRNQSSNQLVEYPLSTVTGFPSVLTNFNATIQNTGLEALVRADVLDLDSWRWNISINVSFPANKLVKFDDIENSPYVNTYKVGQPLSVRYLYTSIGVDKETGLYSFVDLNKDGFINELDKSLMNPTDRSYYGGINNTIQYRSFEVSFLFQFSRQQSSLHYTSYMPGQRGYNQPVDVLQRWQEGGDDAQIQKFTGLPASRTNFIYFASSNQNITDASFIRLKTVSLTYRLPQNWSQYVRLSESRFFIQGQNLITVTGYDGLDPETGNQLPPLRMYTAGLQLKF